jgi:thioesterase domain-containing protein
MQRYRGRTILVRARDQPESERALLRADPPGGWSDFLAEAPEIHELPGDHDGLLRPPHVDALARTIGGWLDRGGRDRQA